MHNIEPAKVFKHRAGAYLDIHAEIVIGKQMTGNWLPIRQGVLAESICGDRGNFDLDANDPGRLFYITPRFRLSCLE